MATIGSWGKRNLERLDAEVEEHGYEAIDKALAEILRDGLGQCTSKSGVVLSRIREKLAKHKADAEAAVRKSKEEAAIMRDIEFQTVQHVFGRYENWFDHRFLTADDDKSLFSKIVSDTRTFEPEDALALFRRYQEWDKAQQEREANASLEDLL
jgi:hypothetical protein